MEELFEKEYVDYILYSVIKLKSRYGFKIKLLYADGSFRIIQEGGFSNRKKANDYKNIVAAQLYNRTYVVVKNVKVKDFYKYWYEKRVNTFRYNSQVAYKNIIYNYIIPAYGNKKIINFTSADIQKLYNKTAKKSKSVARLLKTVVFTSLEYARQKNIIGLNPARYVGLPKMMENIQPKILKIKYENPLNIEQVKTLIKASKDTPIYLHILFACLMGLRISEINGLKYSDIDFVHRKIKIQRQLGVNPNSTEEIKKKKMYTCQEIPVKTFSSNRELIIPDIVFEAIIEEKAKYERNKRRRKNDKINPFRDLDYICCSTYGKPRGKGFHNNYFKELLKANNLPNIRFHDLRHTYSTILIMNNYDLKAVSKLMGHANEIITIDIYTDKSKIILDCLDELNPYINEVLPPLENKGFDYTNFYEGFDFDKVVNDLIF